MLPPQFNAWAEQIVQGYLAGHQWRHKVVGCPVAAKETCYLCEALKLKDRT